MLAPRHPRARVLRLSLAKIPPFRDAVKISDTFHVFKEENCFLSIFALSAFWQENRCQPFGCSDSFLVRNYCGPDAADTFSVAVIDKLHGNASTGQEEEATRYGLRSVVVLP